MTSMLIEKRNFLKFLLLSIITCGIYSIIFFVLFVNDINRVCEGDGQTTTSYGMVILLTILTCGIYFYVWMYKLGNRIHDNGPRYGLNIAETGTTLLLWCLLACFIPPCGYVAYYFLITDANYIFEKYNAYISGNGYNVPTV